MDSGASQIAAASQAPAQPIAANSGICRPSSKRKFGGRTVVGNFFQQMVKALHQQNGQERKQAGMRRPSIADRKNKDSWLFLVSLKGDLFFTNEEASIRYYTQFLRNVFGRRASELIISSCNYEYINTFIVELTTTKDLTILQGHDDVEYVKDLHIRVRRCSHAPDAHLDENMDSDVNSSPGNDEKCKTKMVTTDDRPLPLLGTKLFLVSLNTQPLFDKTEDEYNDEEAAIAYNIVDEHEACLVYHKKFLEKAFGSLESRITVVRSYSWYGLNAFVVKVRDTEAEMWHGLFEWSAEVEYVREVKNR